jgi:hypothetical protein
MLFMIECPPPSSDEIPPVLRQITFIAIPALDSPDFMQFTLIIDFIGDPEGFAFEDQLFAFFTPLCRDHLEHEHPVLS